MKTIDDYLTSGYQKWKDKPEIWTKQNGEFVAATYGTLAEDVRSLAAVLQSMNLGKTGILYAGNSYAWMVIDLCLMGYTGISVPVDAAWTVFDLKNSLNKIEADVLFYGTAQEEAVLVLQEEFPQIKFYCIEKDFQRLAEAGRDLPLPKSQSDPDQTVKILFTSGTTSFPKAIPLTQRNLFTNWETLYQRTPMTERDKSYVFLPLNHVYSGVANFLYAMISGMELYLCADLKDMAADMMRVRPTVVCTVPVIMQRFYDAGNEAVLEMLKEIRFLYCGGSFVNPELKQYFRRQGVTLLEAYGTTETSSVIALEVVGDENLESNGVVFENLDVKIEDPDEQGIGEICVRGGSRTAGYLDSPENAVYFDDEGFYHTGDLGYLDEQRHLYIKGRKRRMLDNGNGKKIYADEIEELLLEHNAVKQVSVYLHEGKITAALSTVCSRDEAVHIMEQVNERLPKFKRIQMLLTNESFTGSWFKQ